ncbi:MAG: DUF177 domain-containing protein [Acutalibacteraceae bacterium]|nr:DUF177 domain-containing protein [Acutalibacteraceae bacterium]
MILDLKKLFITENYTVPVDCTFDFSDTEFMGEHPLKKPVEVKGKITNRAGLVTLTLSMVYVFSANCDRCGLPTDVCYSIELEKSLAPEIAGTDSDDIIIVEDYKLDLDELVYTEIIISLPMKHLCREDCKGLCSICGKNLNEGGCNCETKQIDPRLSALAELLKE